MPELRELARIITSGHNLPDISGGSLQNSSKLLYDAVLIEAKKASKPEDRDGVPGYLWRGQVKNIMRGLWKGVSDSGPASMKAQEALYRYLRETGNMRMVERQVRSPSLWWIRKDWNNGAPKWERSESVRDRERRQQRKEVRVTAQEAGEDRDPADIELKYKCPHCDARFRSKVQRSSHIFSYARHESIQEWITRALRELPDVPASPTEVYNYVESLGFLGSASLVSNMMKDMAADKRSSVTMAKVVGRDRPTYALVSRLNEMKTPAFYAPSCREPGCGAGPFKNKDRRIDHEMRVHKDSPNRKWACPDSDWSGYDWAGLNLHLLRSHSDLTNDVRIAILDDVTKKVAENIAVVQAAPWGDKPEIGLLRDEPVYPRTPPAQSQLPLEPVRPKLTPPPPAPEPEAMPPARPTGIIEGSGVRGPRVITGTRVRPDDDDPMALMMRAATSISVKMQQLEEENSKLRDQLKRVDKLGRLADFLETLKDEDEE